MQSAVAAQQLFVAALARGAKRGFALARGGLIAMQLRPRAARPLCLELASVLRAASTPQGSGPMRALSRLYGSLQKSHATERSKKSGKPGTQSNRARAETKA